MSREIKFRVWDIQNERIVDDPYRFDLAQEGSVAPYVFFEDWQDDRDSTGRECYVMQYTGLKDRNGKEIYEDDNITNGSGRIGRVVFHEPSGQWDVVALTYNGNSHHFDPTYWGSHCEIIGNIHENPELLKP